MALLTGSLSCFSQTKNEEMKTEKTIKEVIRKFVSAGETRTISIYDEVLHPEFRVIANRYPSADKTSILTKETYVDLIQKEVIGGTKFKIEFEEVDVTNHSASAKVNLIADKGGQFVTFLLIQNDKNEWKIIADLAVQKE